MDLELGERVPFLSTPRQTSATTIDLENFTLPKSRLWHIAYPGQEIEKKILNHQQVVDRCCLTTDDFKILQKESVAGLCFRQSNKSLLLASQALVLIWNSSACYVSYDNISSKRFQGFIIAAKSWVSNCLPFDNSLVIRAALHLIYKDMWNQVQNLKRDSVCCQWAMCDLVMKGRLLSFKSKKVIGEISGSPGGVAVFLEPKQLQEYKKLWDSIVEQLDSIRAVLITRVPEAVCYWVLCVVFDVTCLAVMVLAWVPESHYSVAFCVLFVLLSIYVCIGWRIHKNVVRDGWPA